MSRHVSSLLGVVLAGATIGGCAAVSSYDKSDDVVPILFKRLECELYKAKSPRDLAQKTVLSDGHWLAFGQLTVVADVGASVGSTSSFTNNFRNEGSNSWGGTPSISTDKKKTFQYFFTVDLDSVDEADCKHDEGNELTLRGDLGVVDAALLAKAVSDTGKNFGYSPTGVGDQKSLFTHEVEFTIKKSIGDAGPTWVLGKFANIGISFGAHREDIDTLQVAFKRVDGETTKARSGAARSAANKGKTSFTISGDNLRTLYNLKMLQRPRF